MTPSRLLAVAAGPLLLPLLVSAVWSAPVKPTTTESALDRPLPEVRFDGVGLADAIDFYRDITGVNIVVDWRALEAARIDKNAPITLAVRNEKFRAVLSDTLDQAGGKAAGPKTKATWQPAGDVVLVGTEESVKILQQTLTGHEKDRADDILGRKLPEVRFDGVSLGDVIDFLRDITGAKIRVDWKAMEKAGIDKDAAVSARLRDVRFADALTFILHDASSGQADYHLADGAITITAAPTTRPGRDEPPRK